MLPVWWLRRLEKNLGRLGTSRSQDQIKVNFRTVQGLFNFRTVQGHSKAILSQMASFLSRVSILTRDTDIANLSVRYVAVSDENGLTYRHSFFIVR